MIRMPRQCLSVILWIGVCWGNAESVADAKQIAGSDGQTNQSIPIVFIVNSETPIDSLTVDEVKRFYLLKSTNWVFGGKVRPINRDNNTSVKSSFIRNVLEMSESDYLHYWVGLKQKTGESEPASVGSSHFVVKIIGVDKQAIGYVPMSFYRRLDDKTKSALKQVLVIE